jgi:hypothetical protein
MSAPDPDDHPEVNASADAPTLASLFGNAVELAQAEAALLRVEMAGNVARFRRGVLWLVVGIAAAVLTVGMVPVVAVLGLMAAGLRAFPAAALVGAVLAIAAVLGFVLARRGMALRRLIPVETLASLRRDAAVVWAGARTAQPGAGSNDREPPADAGPQERMPE